MFELSFNIYSLLMSVAFIIAITFGLLLLFSSGNHKKADRFLATLLFCVALWNASILILTLNIHQYAVGIIWVPLTYTLALGPCFYFYIRYMTDTELVQKTKIWPHFIPVLIEVCLFLIQVFIGIPQGKGYFQTELYLLVDPIVNALAIISLMVYGYLARKRIMKYHQWVENNYSHYHRYNLNWLLRLSSVFLIFLALWLSYFSIDYFMFNYELSIFAYYPFHLTLSVISIWLSVEAFSKPGWVHPETSGTTDDETLDEPTEHVSKELQEKGQWLKNQIEQNLLYLDPELSLKSLADTLSIHPNLTSKIINEVLKQTFSDCINDYRVKAVIKKLHDRRHDNDTFLAIALECGFNSKTTFNRVFKKQMGQTPLAYRNNLPKD